MGVLTQELDQDTYRYSDKYKPITVPILSIHVAACRPRARQIGIDYNPMSREPDLYDLRLEYTQRARNGGIIVKKGKLRYNETMESLANPKRWHIRQGVRVTNAHVHVRPGP